MAMVQHENQFHVEVAVLSTALNTTHVEVVQYWNFGCYVGHFVVLSASRMYTRRVTCIGMHHPLFPSFFSPSSSFSLFFSPPPWAAQRSFYILAFQAKFGVEHQGIPCSRAEVKVLWLP